MNPVGKPYDIKLEVDMGRPLDFNARSRLKHVDQVFKAEISNVIRLTEMEKLFQIRILDPVIQRDRHPDSEQTLAYCVAN